MKLVDLRLLEQLGHDVDGLHLNEGHCTFALLEMLGKGWTREQLAIVVFYSQLTHLFQQVMTDSSGKLLRRFLATYCHSDAKQLVIDAGDPEEGIAESQCLTLQWPFRVLLTR